MQDEVNEKVVALSIKTSKLTAEVLQKAMKAVLGRSAAKSHESGFSQRQAATFQSPAWENHYAAAYETGRKGNEY